jgi:hypothetical protein
MQALHNKISYHKQKTVGNYNYSSPIKIGTLNAGGYSFFGRTVR